MSIVRTAAAQNGGETMSDYIEVMKILEYLDVMIRTLSYPLSELGEKEKAYIEGFKEARSVVERFPTADAAPVVRCESCTSGIMSDNNKYIICCRFSVGMEFGDFCSHGERKNGDGGHAAN